MAKRGAKVCPECNTEHGARKRQCDCGHEFAVKSATKGTKRGKKSTPKPAASHVAQLPAVNVCGAYIAARSLYHLAGSLEAAVKILEDISDIED